MNRHTGISLSASHAYREVMSMQDAALSKMCHKTCKLQVAVHVIDFDRAYASVWNYS